MSLARAFPRRGRRPAAADPQTVLELPPDALSMPGLAEPVNVRRLVLATSALGALATVFISLAPFVNFAYRNRAGHVAIETAATVIGLLAAQLVYGRFKRSASLHDLLLTGALLVLAATNLAFSLVPSLVDARPGVFATWSPVFARLAGAGVFAAAAFVRAPRVRDPVRYSHLLLGICIAALLLIAAIVAALGNDLPRAIDPGLSPESSGRPRIVGNTLLLSIQVVAMVIYATAAIGFTRRAARTRDDLLAWFGAAASIAAFSRLNYFLFPSLYTEWFYTGDFLRLGFYLLLFAGAFREIGLYQRELATAVTLAERNRLAREIHDGLAQDMMFIVGEARRLAKRAGKAGQADSDALERLSTTAERALDESRDAIAALARPLEEPLEISIRRASEEVAGRAGVSTSLGGDADIRVPPQTRDALIRIVREAITNAVRHGAARSIHIALTAGDQLSVRVADDGRGFRPGGSNPGFGLLTMRERAEQLGGRISIDSELGRGTVVEVRIPWPESVS